MLNRIALRIVLLVALAVSTVTITACQTTGKAHGEALTGDAQVAHERHDTGIESHTAD
ncbi:MAG: hypothetical protein JSU63_19070 [Phycisphaerales bacterium]|nr:MAG: hypothetical protein JSU63_19070 [Phycisphaerales bacterium]